MCVPYVFRTNLGRKTYIMHGDIAIANGNGLRFRTNVSSLLLRRNDTSCMLIADNTSSSNFLTFELIESMRGLSLEPMHYHNKSAFKTIESNTN